MKNVIGTLLITAALTSCVEAPKSSSSSDAETEASSTTTADETPLVCSDYDNVYHKWKVGSLSFPQLHSDISTELDLTNATVNSNTQVHAVWTGKTLAGTNGRGECTYTVEIYGDGCNGSFLVRTPNIIQIMTTGVADAVACASLLDTTGGTYMVTRTHLRFCMSDGTCLNFDKVVE